MPDFSDKISLYSTAWEGPVPIVHSRFDCANPENVAGYSGVYKLRLVDAELKPIPIHRERKVDVTGTLRIGRTGNLRQRFVKTRRDYGAAMTSGDQVEFRQDVELVYPGFGLAFEYIRLTEDEPDSAAEKVLHAEYLVEFGEEAETPVSGSVLHEPDHKWRKWLRSHK